MAEMVPVTTRDISEYIYDVSLKVTVLVGVP